LEEMLDILINIYGNTPSYNKRFNPRYPLGRETFHLQRLKQE
jgi:hypothetical protein